MVLLAWSGQVSAQAPEEREAAAREHFLVGSDHFEAGDYQRAAEEFEAAYELSPRPELLYNVYLAHERLGNLERAEEALAEFVEAGTPGHRQAPLEQRLVRLRERLAEQRAEEEAAAERERQLREQAEQRRDPGAWPWVLLGSGGALVITGTALLLVARGDIDAVENPGEMPRWEDVADRHDRAPLLSTLGIVGLSLGGALMAGGLIWALTAPGDEDQLALDVGLGSLRLRGTF